MEFKKATLQEVSTKPSATPAPVGDAVPVQINPATLRLQASASVDSGKDTGRQRSQYQGTTSTLTFDLVFDTADEGTSEAPVDVRKRTAQVERFVWPADKKSAPPRVKFSYGTLVVIGVMTSLNIDLDLFSANGVPLRAKCAVSIKEQKTEFDLARDGAGANTGAGATPPLQPSAAGPGAGSPTAPAPPPADRTGTALAGETASAFANRMGLDPRAWKGLEGITDPLRLEAGLAIDFSSSLSVEGGLGVQVGATAGLGSTPAGTDPAVTAAGSGTPAASGPVPATLPIDGHALAAAGGLTAALDKAAAVNAGLASQAASSAFTGPGAAAPSTPPASPQSLGSTVAPPTAPSGASQQPPTGSTPVGPDPRSLSYGYGVPLRPRRGTSGPTSIGLVHEIHRTIQQGGDMPPASRDATVPPWQALAATAVGSAGSSGGGCGCGGCGCGCGGRPDPRDRSGSTTKPCGCGGP